MHDIGGKRLLRRPYIVGEIGCSHEGRLDHAKQLVRIASRSDCDAVKVQFYEPERLIERRKGAKKFAAVYQKYAVPKEWLSVVADVAHDSQLEFVVSVYDRHGAELAAPMADVLKISSFECTDLHFLEALEQYGKPIIVSTGMTSTEELCALVTMRQMLHVPVYLLHCVSSYPVELASMHLRVIRECGLDGLSDHSAHVDMGGWAVSAGASIVEVHMSPLHRALSQSNPDWGYSLDEGTLDKYVARSRQAAICQGSGEPGERPVLAAEAECRPYRVQLEEA